jgi:ribonuclease HI
VEQEKKDSWEKTTEGLESIQATSRMHKLIAQGKLNKIGTLKKQDKTFTSNNSETLVELASTHFSNFEVDPIDTDAHCNDIIEVDLHESQSIFNTEAIKWSIHTFKPYKSSGIDEIFPALLQKAYKHIKDIVQIIFIKSHAFGYIPKIWQEIKVTYIPKAGNRDSENPKSYRPISLSSFLLKTMEKIIDRYLRDNILKESPLSIHQYAYQGGKSTESALKALVKKLEQAVNIDKEAALAVFMDIQGAFDNTKFDVICNALVEKGVDLKTGSWIKTMLENRKVHSSLGTATLIFKVLCGCPQGGVLSPLLWCMVVDSLLRQLNMSGIYAQGYADDATVVRRTYKTDKKLNPKDPILVLIENMQQTLRIVENWCNNVGLAVNPSKTTLILFTKKQINIEDLPKITFFNTELNYSNSVKYLGLTIDRKLLWNEHLDNVVKRAKSSLWICRKLVGKLWGLKPKLAYWIYTAMIRPIVSYASIVWWRKLKKKGAKDALNSLQRLACAITLSGTKSTPRETMEVLLNLPPLDIFLEQEAMGANCRFKISSKREIRELCDQELTNQYVCFDEFDDLKLAIELSDYMDKEYNYNIPFATEIPDENYYIHNSIDENNDIQRWYTDGSKTLLGTGCGVYCPQLNKELSVSLNEQVTVFQAEVFAIHNVTKINKLSFNQNIEILSDSQAALKAISSNIIQSKTVKQAVVGLQELARNNRVELKWIPAHRGYTGNERADELAKEGANKCNTRKRRRVELPITKTKIRSILNEIQARRHKQKWARKSGTLKHSKKFVSEPDPKRTKQILNLSRRQVHHFTGAMTGHYPTRYMLKKMKIITSEVCRFCEAGKEDMEHLLCHCDCLDIRRFTYFDKFKLEPQDFYQLDVRKVATFLESLKIR